MWKKLVIKFLQGNIIMQTMLGELTTLCLKKNGPFYFYDNFGKYWLILIVPSLLHLQISADESELNSTTSSQNCCRTALRNLNVQFLWC